MRLDSRPLPGLPTLGESVSQSLFIKRGCYSKLRKFLSTSALKFRLPSTNYDTYTSYTEIIQ